MKTLYDQYRPVVYAIAMRVLHNPDEAEECVQEVFVRVILAIHQVRDKSRLAGWIKRITLNVAFNRLKQRRKPVELTNDYPDPTPEPLDQLIEQEDVERLRAELGRLKPLDRDTLEAFYMGGQSIRKMSAEFGVPEGTIKRRLHVARHRLAERLAA
jgi:RNA polymerase sigma-70 factor (ECF subfamily)